MTTNAEHDMATSGETPADEDPVEELVHDRDELRARAIRKLGIVGDADVELPPLMATLRKAGVSAYPLAALGLLAITDTFQRQGFAVLTPDISRSLGMDKGLIAAAIAIQTLAAAMAPLLMASLAQRRARRALICITTGIAWSLFTVATGYVISFWGLAFVLVATGVAAASVHALHQPLLFDLYPPSTRVRVLSSYTFGDASGNLLGPLLVAVLTAVVGLTWRGTFLGMGMVSLLLVLMTVRLRDPGFGRWDEDMIRDTVHEDEDGTDDASDATPTLGFFEIVRRVMIIPTVRRMFAGYAIFGVLLIPFQTFLYFFLEERWNMGPGARGLFFAGAAGASMIGLTQFGRRAELAFRKDPAWAAKLAGMMIAAGVTLIALGGLAPWFWLMALLMGLAPVLITLSRPAVFAGLLGVVPSYMRPHTASLAGVFLGGVGGLFGAIFLSGIDARFGVGGAMVALFVPGILASLVIASARKHVGKDLERMVDEVIEDEEIRTMRATGKQLPMLACRNIDFYYGQLQVLFGVDLTVDDGEMAALLGVNGAGKSTLLRVISGTGLPVAGSVRFGGTDITYMDAERRLLLGISQIPGGRAVFGPLTVVENLRGMGYTIGRNRRKLDEAIDQCFDAFPRLAARRNQLASTLSGGEQQMLALSKALIIEPRLLLIDELSLGLAPVIVGELLEMVRGIKARGTAVLLVEQSVNIALNLVDHAYFMEKGEIRFDGRAEDLLERGDLLRAVFLEGAATQSGGSK